MKYITIGIFVHCLVALSILLGKYSTENEIEELFGIGYESIQNEVSVCRSLADEDSECHISMKVIEKYPVNIDVVGNRRDRFCENYNMKGKVPNKRIHREVIQ